MGDIFLCNLKWKIIKYNINPGIFKLINYLRGIDQESQKNIGLTFSDINTQSLRFNSTNDDNYYIDKRIVYKGFFIISFIIDYNRYDEYQRTEKSFLDSISNIFSLSLAVFKCISLFSTKFYSNSFDKLLKKFYLA